MNPNPPSPEPPKPSCPPGDEILTNEFLRKFGAQKDMRWRNRHCPEHEWSDWQKTLGHLCLSDVLATTDFEFCAPLGTTAAALTPLPEPVCDCGLSKTDKELTGGCLISCSSQRAFRHVLPGELAGMEKKPEELLIAAPNRQVRWQSYTSQWPIPLVWVEDFVFALPLPLSTEHKEGGLGTFLQTSESAKNLSPDSVATQPQEERREECAAVPTVIAVDDRTLSEKIDDAFYGAQRAHDVLGMIGAEVAKLENENKQLRNNLKDANRRAKEARRAATPSPSDTAAAREISEYFHKNAESDWFPTEKDIAAILACHHSPDPERDRVLAEVDRVMGICEEAMQDALDRSIDAPTYPDGPCLDKEIRDELKAALATLRARKGGVKA